MALYVGKDFGTSNVGRRKTETRRRRGQKITKRARKVRRGEKSKRRKTKAKRRWVLRKERLPHHIFTTPSCPRKLVDLLAH